MRPGLLSILVGSAFFCALFASAQAGKVQNIVLPPAQTSGGKPLMEALRLRHTTREFNSDKIPLQTLANLLWAGFGINRPQTGQRTAPSAMNSQEIDVYVALPEGLFLYDAKANILAFIAPDDIRSKAGGQDSFKQAPLTLIYVADLDRLAKASPETRPFYAGFDAGCICQNVYLYCASQELVTVVHDLDRGALAAAMNLRQGQRIILAQAVGFPQKKTTDAELQEQTSQPRGDRQ